MASEPRDRPAFAPKALRRGLAVASAEAEARRRSGARGRVSGSPRGEAPRMRLVFVGRLEHTLREPREVLAPERPDVTDIGNSSSVNCTCFERSQSLNWRFTPMSESAVPQVIHRSLICELALASSVGKFLSNTPASIVRLPPRPRPSPAAPAGGPAGAAPGPLSPAEQPRPATSRTRR